MRTRLTARGYLGLLVGLAAAAWCLAAGPAGAPVSAPATAQEQAETAPPPFVPTERIDVEQAVNFPYDI